jgi:hypothetical protein
MADLASFLGRSWTGVSWDRLIAYGSIHGALKRVAENCQDKNAKASLEKYLAEHPPAAELPAKDGPAKP